MVINFTILAMKGWQIIRDNFNKILSEYIKPTLILMNIMLLLWTTCVFCKRLFAIIWIQINYQNELNDSKEALLS